MSSRYAQKFSLPDSFLKIVSKSKYKMGCYFWIGCSLQLIIRRTEASFLFKEIEESSKNTCFNPPA